MAAPHYFLTSLIVRAPHELFTGDFSSQNDRGRKQRILSKKTSTKIGEGICRESDAVICFFLPSINLQRLLCKTNGYEHMDCILKVLSCTKLILTESKQCLEGLEY